MNIAVINGTNHKGSTHYCVEKLIQKLQAYEPITTTEFFLPKDMPHFCNGCFQCFNKGEHACPHYEAIRPIQTAIENADLIILSSPCYCMDVSGQMKALLDHFGYQWMAHRPNARMFSKIGVSVTSTAGAGAKRTAKTLDESLSFWGVGRRYRLANALNARTPKEIPQKKIKRLEKQTNRLSKAIYQDYKDQRKPDKKVRFFFFIMGKMQKNNTWNFTDKAHWEQNGWLNKQKPF